MSKIFVFILLPFLCFSQPFKEEIAKFRIQDSINFPKENSILLIGSSSFTIWSDINDYFPNKEILNRGFGGSTLLDLHYYKKEIIYPYRPSMIFMYCGENDFAMDTMLTFEQVFKRFESLYLDIKKQHKKIPFIYISMKPSPSRWHLKDKFIETNKKIKELLVLNNDHFIDVWPLMLENGMPNKTLFLEDELHMNKKGYEIWSELMKPFIEKY